MKTSQFFLSLILSFFVALALYTMIQDKANWFMIGSGVLLALLTLIYVFSDLTDYRKYLKGKTLKVFDVGIIDFFRTILVFTILGLWVYLSAKFNFSFGVIVLGIALIIFIGMVYATQIPTAGLYKNGKYLGKVYNANIQISDKLSIGKGKSIEHIGKLKITRNGEELAKIVITAEGLMELTPDKISETFPEIKGKIEKFGERFFKVGDYTLDYDIGSDYNYVIDGWRDKKKDDFLYNPLYSGYGANLYNDL
jgi:hypothetical protein